MNKYEEYHWDHRCVSFGDIFRKHENNQIFLNDKCVLWLRLKIVNICNLL